MTHKTAVVLISLVAGCSSMHEDSSSQSVDEAEKTVFCSNSQSAISDLTLAVTPLSEETVINHAVIETSVGNFQLDMSYDEEMTNAFADDLSYPDNVFTGYVEVPYFNCDDVTGVTILADH